MSSSPFDVATPSSHQVVALVLAAGQARRFGAPKLLAPLRGRPLIWHTVRRVLEARVGKVIVVSGGAHERLADALGELPVRIVRNTGFGEGLSSSLKVGITAAGQTAVLVALGDQPTVPTHVIRDLVHVYHATGKLIICPSYNGEIGNPVVLSPVVFPELMQLGGDRGARRVVERDASRVSEVSFEFDSLLNGLKPPSSRRETLQRVDCGGGALHERKSYAISPSLSHRMDYEVSV